MHGMCGTPCGPLRTICPVSVSRLPSSSRRYVLFPSIYIYIFTPFMWCLPAVTLADVRLEVLNTLLVKPLDYVHPVTRVSVSPAVFKGFPWLAPAGSGRRSLLGRHRPDLFYFCFLHFFFLPLSHLLLGNFEISNFQHVGLIADRRGLTQTTPLSTQFYSGTYV